MPARFRLASPARSTSISSAPGSIWAVDGTGNTVVECNTAAEPEGPANPWGNAFYETETTLRTELEACRRANLESQRYWKIVNPNKTNHIGRPVGYKLMPTNAVPLLPASLWAVGQAVRLREEPPLGDSA